MSPDRAPSTHESVTRESVTRESVTHESVTREYITREYITREYIMIATCRSGPQSQADTALAAGDYTVWLLDPRAPEAVAATKSRRACSGSLLTHPEALPLTHDDLPTGDVVLVIHGFNCTALDGIAMAASVRDSLHAWGQPITAPRQPREPGGVHVLGFTWPCEHTLFPGYMHDKATVARFAAFSLANLLLELRRHGKERRIHVVAHSTGCFLLVKALNMLAVLNGLAVEQPVVNQVIWFAADLNADALELTAPRPKEWRATGNHPRVAAWWRGLSRSLRPPRAQSAAAVFHAQPVPAPDTTTTAAPPAATSHPTSATLDHPLDGYGYAAFGAMEALRSYSSFHDEALAVAPWANHTTEETGAATGLLRLGWCGPLHPALTLARPHVKLARHLALVECSASIKEHGAYFTTPAVQRDMTACLSAYQHATLTAAHPSQPSHHAVAVPPELEPINAWHAGTALQFPAQDGKPRDDDLRFLTARQEQLTFFRLRASAAVAHPTVPKDGAPQQTPAKGLARFGLWVWHGPIGHGYVWLVRRYYHV